MCDQYSMPGDRLAERELGTILSDEDHRRNTAWALQKPAHEVSNIELINHWMTAGGAEMFHQKIRSGEICI